MNINRPVRLITLALILLLAPNLVAQLAPVPKPAPAPARWRGLIGEYGSDDNILIVFENEGTLHAWYKRIQLYDLSEQSQNTFVIRQEVTARESALFLVRIAMDVRRFFGSKQKAARRPAPWATRLYFHAATSNPSPAISFTSNPFVRSRS
jgi:hypothetical protein